jgi:hypothetical protein
MLVLVENIIVQVEAVNKGKEVGKCWRELFSELEGSQQGCKELVIGSWG